MHARRRAPASRRPKHPMDYPARKLQPFVCSRRILCLDAGLLLFPSDNNNSLPCACFACSDPWTNTGTGARVSDVGTCGYLKCHAEVQAWYASMADTLNPINTKFDHNPVCAKTVFQAFYSAAQHGLIACSLPTAWRNNGWNCNTEPPAAPPGGLSGGAAFGIAFVVIVFVGVVGYGAYRVRRGTAPAWLAKPVASVGSWVSSKGTGSSSRVGSAYVYTSGAADKPLVSSGAYGSI